jgi:hypothetical protein
MIELLTALNTNKFFVGISLLLMNFGVRHAIGDLTKFQEQVLKSDLARKVIMFCVFFVGTRDVLVAIMLTFAFYFVVYGIFNENNKVNVIYQISMPFKEMYSDYLEKVKSV